MREAFKNSEIPSPSVTRYTTQHVPRCRVAMHARTGAPPVPARYGGFGWPRPHARVVRLRAPTVRCTRQRRKRRHRNQRGGLRRPDRASRDRSATRYSGILAAFARKAALGNAVIRRGSRPPERWSGTDGQKNGSVRQPRYRGLSQLSHAVQALDRRHCGPDFRTGVPMGSFKRC